VAQHQRLSYRHMSFLPRRVQRSFETGWDSLWGVKGNLIFD